MSEQTTKKGRIDIFLKNFILFAVIISVSFTILGVSLMAFVRGYWNDERTKLLKENTQSISQTVMSMMEKDEMNDRFSSKKILIASTLSVISTAIDADIFITDTNGNVVLCPERAQAKTEYGFTTCPKHDNMQISKAMLTQVTSDGNVFTGPISSNETEYYIVVHPIIKNGTNIGYSIATMPKNSANSFLNDIMKMFLMATSIAMLLSFLGAYALTYSVVTPLQQMSKAAKKFAKGDFSYRVNVNSDDELGDLATAFNDMASELAVLEKTRRTFVANVSHELKTPMTTISGFIDGILDGTIPPEKEKYYLKIVSDEVKRLSRLVVAMLNMSKIESGNFKIKPHDYDISEQIFTIFLNFEQKINDKHIEVLGMENLSNTIVYADEDIIYQVVYNLVDNAVKFTNENGYIEVSAEKANDKVFIKIKNSGQGISSEEATKIFERFYKVDRSRSLDVKGAGLGLYLVKNMVELHGGQITVNSVENEYTEFTFCLPGGNSNE